MQIRSVDRTLGAARIALDDDMLIEIVVRIQRVGQGRADQEDAEQAETGKPQQRHQQYRKHADQENRQQRKQQHRIGFSGAHRTASLRSQMTAYGIKQALYIHRIWAKQGSAARGNHRAAISERISARNSSISFRPFLVSMCQKVQPLQAPEPWATAPMRWIEPTLSPSMMAPSARTSAPWRFLESTSLVPGEIMPRSISSENATRGASRAVMNGASVASGSGSTAAIRDSAARA